MHHHAAAGPAYDAAIEAAGGIDVQILGIGADGHIGFNEPGSSLASGTRVKTLTERTRIDNARFFDNDINQVPTHCITQGIGTIMKARHLVLLAFGAGKAEASAVRLRQFIMAEGTKLARGTSSVVSRMCRRTRRSCFNPSIRVENAMRTNSL